jgi:hypothetical protein
MTMWENTPEGAFIGLCAAFVVFLGLALWGMRGP